MDLPGKLTRRGKRKGTSPNVFLGDAFTLLLPICGNVCFKRSCSSSRAENARRMREAGDGETHFLRKWGTFGIKRILNQHFLQLRFSCQSGMAFPSMSDLFRHFDELPIVIHITADTRQSLDVSIKHTQHFHWVSAKRRNILITGRPDSLNC